MNTGFLGNISQDQFYSVRKNPDSIQEHQLIINPEQQIITQNIQMNPKKSMRIPQLTFDDLDDVDAFMLNNLKQLNSLLIGDQQPNPDLDILLIWLKQANLQSTSKVVDKQLHILIKNMANILLENIQTHVNKFQAVSQLKKLKTKQDEAGLHFLNKSDAEIKQEDNEGMVLVSESQIFVTLKSESLLDLEENLTSINDISLSSDIYEKLNEQREEIIEKQQAFEQKDEESQQLLSAIHKLNNDVDQLNISNLFAKTRIKELQTSYYAIQIKHQEVEKENYRLHGKLDQYEKLMQAQYEDIKKLKLGDVFQKQDIGLSQYQCDEEFIIDFIQRCLNQVMRVPNDDIIQSPTNTDEDAVSDFCQSRISHCTEQEDLFKRAIELVQSRTNAYLGQIEKKKKQQVIKISVQGNIQKGFLFALVPKEYYNTDLVKRESDYEKMHQNSISESIGDFFFQINDRVQNFDKLFKAIYQKLNKNSYKQKHDIQYHNLHINFSKPDPTLPFTQYNEALKSTLQSVQLTFSTIYQMICQQMNNFYTLLYRAREQNNKMSVQILKFQQ